MDWIFPPGNTVGLSEAGFVGAFLLKILYLLAFLLYTIFAFVVIRQVRLMEKTYHTSLNTILTIFAWAHFLVSVAVLIFAFLVL